jgi:hypothetical protein
MKHNFPSYEIVASDISILVGKKLFVRFAFSIAGDDEFHLQEDCFVIKHVAHDCGEKEIFIQQKVASFEVGEESYTLGFRISEKKGLQFWYSEGEDNSDKKLDEGKTEIKLI